jgi:hypothetical protein
MEIHDQKYQGECDSELRATARRIDADVDNNLTERDFGRIIGASTG